MLTSCLAGVFGGDDVSEPRSGTVEPRPVFAVFAILRLSRVLVILSPSIVDSLSASGLCFDAGCVVAVSCSSFAAMRRGGFSPLGEV